MSRQHKSGNGRHVSNWAIIEAKISYFRRPETIELTSSIAHLVTSWPFDDLGGSQRRPCTHAHLRVDQTTAVFEAGLATAMFEVMRVLLHGAGEASQKCLVVKIRFVVLTGRYWNCYNII